MHQYIQHVRTFFHIAHDTDRFARAAPAEWVTAHPFPLHYHELFNDLDSAEVFQALHDWLTARFAPVALGRAAPF